MHRDQNQVIAKGETTLRQSVCCWWHYRSTCVKLGVTKYISVNNPPH